MNKRDFLGQATSAGAETWQAHPWHAGLATCYEQAQPGQAPGQNKIEETKIFTIFPEETKISALPSLSGGHSSAVRRVPELKFGMWGPGMQRVPPAKEQSQLGPASGGKFLRRLKFATTRPRRLTF